MRSSTFTGIVAVVVVACSIGAARSARAQLSSPSDRPTLSVEAIRKLHDAGQYRSALQEAARTLRTPAGEQAKYDLQLIRGDSLLHLDDSQTALSAYAIAAKSPDPKVFTEARATSVLIRRSRELKYTAKAGGEPIDIVDMQNRKRAAAALLNDQLAADRRELEAALNATNLMPIIKAVEPILDLRALEELATGKAAETGALTQKVGEHARDLIDREIKRLNDQITQYERIANAIIDDGGNGVTRRGLISTQRNDLRGMINYLGEIREAGERGLQLARVHGGMVAEWERVVRDASDVQRHGEDVLGME